MGEVHHGAIGEAQGRVPSLLACDDSRLRNQPQRHWPCPAPHHPRHPPPPSTTGSMGAAEQPPLLPPSLPAAEADQIRASLSAQLAERDSSIRSLRQQLEAAAKRHQQDLDRVKARPGAGSSFACKSRPPCLMPGAGTSLPPGRMLLPRTRGCRPCWMPRTRSAKRFPGRSERRWRQATAGGGGDPPLPVSLGMRRPAGAFAHGTCLPRPWLPQIFQAKERSLEEQMQQRVRDLEERLRAAEQGKRVSHRAQPLPPPGMEASRVPAADWTCPLLTVPAFRMPSAVPRRCCTRPTPRTAAFPSSRPRFFALAPRVTWAWG